MVKLHRSPTHLIKSLWPQSFLRTSLLYCCLTQSIAIQILININLLISIKSRLPLDQFSLASVWHCRTLITSRLPPLPLHLSLTHTPTNTPLTLASIGLTVFESILTVIKKCPWCNFMPVDAGRPYAEDYGMPALSYKQTELRSQAPGPWPLYRSLLMAPTAGVSAIVTKYSGVSAGGCHQLHRHRAAEKSHPSHSWHLSGLSVRSVTAFIQPLCLKHLHHKKVLSFLLDRWTQWRKNKKISIFLHLILQDTY